MGLQYAVEDLNDLDESLQELYEQDGDRYILRVDGIPQPEDTSGLKSKVQQLMDEAKEAKRKAKELEAQKQRQEVETAQEKGEFKNLWEQAQAKLAEKDKELQEFTTKIQQKDINLAARQIGSQLAKADAKRAEVLADYASRYARHDGEKVQFLVGGIEVDSTELMNHLTKEFPFLVDGSSATGGGASSSSSSGAAKSLNRADFDKLTAPKKMQFVKDGGIISD
jgi:DNA repair exonuclease SbcCD ATPase subunit